jgi:hypothetical protein
MKANRAFELIVTKGNRLDPNRIDHLEILEVDSGEVVLFWDTLRSQTGKLARALKRDLAQLEDEAFLAKWRRYEPG